MSFERGRMFVLGMVWLLAALSACSGSADDPASTAQSQGPAIVGAPFDPPSRFDLTQALSLGEDEVTHGTLHGTAFFSVVDGSLRATDLVSGQRSWSTRLGNGAEQTYLRDPFVLNDTVVVVTAEETGKSQDGSAEGGSEDSVSMFHGDYSVNIVGAATSGGDKLWEQSFPAQAWRLTADRSPSIDEVLYINTYKMNDVLLVSTPAGSSSSPRTLAIDLRSGEALWQSEASVVAVATGRYALAYQDGWNTRVIDVQTGDIGVEMLEPSSEVIDWDVDPHGNPSYISVHVRGIDSSESYLRFSSTDGSTQPFTPAEDDIRYRNGVDCSLDEGQSVLMCKGGQQHGVYGVDPYSGQVLWALDRTSGSTVSCVTQFHGNVYGKIDGGYSVIALDTGVVINSDTGLLPIQTTISGRSTDVPIQVNEYGVVGMRGERWDESADNYVWVPAYG